MLLHNFSHILATAILWANDKPNTEAVLKVYKKKDGQQIGSVPISTTYKGLLTFHARAGLENLKHSLDGYYLEGLTVRFVEVSDVSA